MADEPSSSTQGTPPIEPQTGDSSGIPPVTSSPAGPVFTAEDNVKDWMKGKTKEELATLTDQLYQAVVDGNAQPPQGVPPQTQQQPYYATPSGVTPQTPTAPQAVPTDDDWISAPAKTMELYKASLQQQFTQTVTPQLEALHQTNFQITRNFVAEKYKDVFARWGPEVDLMLNQINMDQRTPEVVERAVQLVKSQHLDEIVQERVKKETQEEISRMSGGVPLRSGAAVVGGTQNSTDLLDLEDDKIPPQYVATMKEAGIDQEVVDRFLLKAYPELSLSAARKKYMDQLRNGTVSKVDV